MEDAGPTGPCGTPCRECPERDLCEADCNAADGEEKKRDEIVRSSTRDKVASFKAVLEAKHPEG